MYVVVAVLFIAGDQVPVMLLLDVVGKVNVPPEHIAATWVNVGVVGWFTVATIFALHPSLFVYVIVEFPWVIPTTKPFDTVAILGLLDIQAFIAAGVPLPTNCELPPTQTIF